MAKAKGAAGQYPDNTLQSLPQALGIDSKHTAWRTKQLLYEETNKGQGTHVVIAIQGWK